MLSSGQERSDLVSRIVIELQLDGSAQVAHRRVFHQQREQRQLYRHQLLEVRDQLDGVERIDSQLEEVIVRSNVGYVQNS